MPKKIAPPSKPAAKIAPVTRSVAASTPVRNTPIPKAAAPARKEVTHDMISLRAYSIHLSGAGGSEMDNWLRAERELKGL